MGNFQSVWHRRHRRGEDTSETSFSTSSTNGGYPLEPSTTTTTASNGNGGEGLVERNAYNLRQTVSRLRRRISLQRETSRNGADSANRSQNRDSIIGTQRNESSSSISSSTNRRRRRNPQEDLDLEESSSRRRRLEQQIRSEMFTPEPESNNEIQRPPSMFFYFSLPQQTEIESEHVNGEARPEGRSRMHQAAEFFRDLLGSSTNGRGERVDTPLPHPLSPSDNPESPGQMPIPGPNQHLVVVRLRRIPMQEDITNTTDDERTVFQWTIYFVIPNEDPSSRPIDFDHNQAVQSAFMVLRSMMMGENMTYEDWVRMQEMLGSVNRGVTKEQIDQYSSSKPWMNNNVASDCPELISCSICLSDYMNDESVRTLPCSHSYHTECIDTWLGSCNRCPLCRHQPVPTP